jgi:hypothetical protein
MVTVAGTPRHTVEELEEACRQLRADLADVDDIELSEVPGEPPEEGTRSGIVAVETAIFVAYYGGKIAVKGAADLKKLKDTVVPAVARVFHLWLARNKDTRAIIRLPDGTEADLTNLSEAEIRTILEHAVPRDGSAAKSAPIDV